jgi:hypothetical protein
MTTRDIAAASIALLLLVQMPLNAQRSFRLTINRSMTCDDGATGGALYLNGSEVARTLELPWGNNERNASQVPSGTYDAFVRADGSKGWRIELRGVRGRSNVQLHIGNYPSEIEGCILVGTDVAEATDPGTGKRTCSVRNSGTALRRIRGEMDSASSDGMSSQPLHIEVEVR